METALKKAAILNDTSTRYHHGCTKVIENLVAGLEARGLEIAETVPARYDWADDIELCNRLAQVDLLVVNGEGTIHHGKPAGENLLKVASHPALQNVPKALINALYENNPPEWGAYLGGFDLLSARDSASAREMKTSCSSINVRWVPDLSMASAVDVGKVDRTGLLIGDSVRWNRRRELAKFAARVSAERYAPTKTLSSSAWLWPGVRNVLYVVYNGYLSKQFPKFLMPANTHSYLELISSSQVHVTGRFHAVCLSLLTQTPFLAVTSNAQKIERLLLDVGLDGRRVLSPEQLQGVSRKDVLKPFDPEEVREIEAYLETARRSSTELFDDLVALARGELRK